jgi:hypothetical protein
VSAETGEQWREHGADRPGVYRAVRVPTGPLVDGAHVEAGGAPDAPQRRPPDPVGERRRPAVVQQDDVHVLRAVAGRDAGPERRVRVHPLAGRGPGQELEEHLEVAPRRQQLLDAHHGDERLRQRQAHAAVALGLDDRERAGLRDREVRTADRDPGGEEGPAQIGTGGHGEHPRFVGEVRVDPGHVVEEDLPDLRPVPVDRRHEDV